MRASTLESNGHLLEWLLEADADEDGNRSANKAGAYTRENTLQSRRDERDRFASSPGSVSATQVETFLTETGLDNLVEREFRRLSSEETRVSGRTGSQVEVRNAIRRFAGDHSVDEVYERFETLNTGDRAVGVALDMSSSMSGSERDAKAAVAAFAKAVESIGDEFVAVGFSNRSTRLVTGPTERFETWHLDAVQASGGTPTAAGVDDALTLLAATNASEQLLFVVTDGSPTTMLDKDAFESSEAEVQFLVERARDRDVDVVGIGIGDINHSLMRHMFGEHAYTKTGVHRLDDELVSAYRTQATANGGVV